ncbi:DUF3795 domain-containing protein [Flexilinea flocculi]|jgi:hypothetical protein|uniref:DUF3795 domain-containing protein n=1 Tax=Flexilinea flocculi TaxID=1678840 RepID=A0A0S7BL70_9CHLR|nr:DUF3795 domain-containing protein [Flexilinea flocculi]NMB92889.1 DUF3795 domain-containing protein [Flexilinea flocculi]GAP41005.1 hypothetical protein ATC1_13987 [Flexilinea flocculi]
MIDENLIAPCGMNCILCVSYQFMKGDLNQKGFHKKYCPGCNPRGLHCLFMGDHCELLRNGRVRFCFECANYPCKRLKALDSRYQKKYRMSMIENLTVIQEQGLQTFLDQQETRWQCAICGALICCHIGLCLHCDLEKIIQNKKYRKDLKSDDGIA